MELMKDDSLTSEEKLLRLIRKKDKHKDSKEVKEPREDAPLPFQENNTTISSDEIPVAAVPAPQKQVDSLAFFIRILSVTAICILIFILLKYTRGKTPVTEQTAAPEPVAEDSIAETTPTFEIPSFDSYKQTMESRDIFQAPWEKPIETMPSSTASTSAVAGQLKLVGIVLDQDPKAIVEDLATQQTFFVSPGGKIGNATVAEIREDKVILIFGQERVELVQ